jgi:hypothetical protein
LDSDDDDGSQDDNSIGEDANQHAGNQQTATYCSWEDQMMSKARTIYIYRNDNLLESQANELKPIAGIVVLEEIIPGLLHNQQYVVVRMPGRSFGWCRMTFDDENGVFFKGVWYADALFSPLTKTGCPQTMQGIQSIAKMAFIAIPLRYALGDNQEHSMKYGVITNWWRERQGDGQYCLPGLDSFLYEIE